MILASLRYHGNLCESHNLLVWDGLELCTVFFTWTELKRTTSTMEADGSGWQQRMATDTLALLSSPGIMKGDTTNCDGVSVWPPSSRKGIGPIRRANNW